MNVFEALNLSEGEMKVYEALINLGETTTGPLYKEASVSQSKVYEILDRLKKKGLAASIIKSGITHWHPANPSIYLDKARKELDVAKRRKEVLEKELPKLLKQEHRPKDEAQIFIGYNGFRTALYSFMDSFSSKDEFLVFGSPKPIPEPFYSFLASYNKERVKKNIHARFLYGEELRKFATELYDLQKTKVRYIESLTPASLAIGNDRIIIFNFDSGGKTIVITGKDMAHNFKIFFESLWRMAKE